MLHFITSEEHNAPVISAQYDPLLVIASLFIAAFACYISFLLIKRIASLQQQQEKRLWTLLSSCFLGLSLWAMHFVGLLAYTLPIATHFDITITLLSILPCIFASYIVISPRVGQLDNFWIRSILMGIAISIMHYLGLLAVTMPAHVVHDAWLLSASVVTAIILCGIALKINALQQKLAAKLWLKLLLATLMGSALASVHYLAMLSINIFAANHTSYIADHNNDELAQILTFVVLLSSVFLISCMELRSRSLLSAKLKVVLNTVQDAVISFNKQGVIEFANPATCEVFGFAQQDLIGKNITLLVPETNTEFYQLFQSKQANYKLSGKSQRLIGRKQCGDNFPITAAVSPIRKQLNVSFVATIKDLTDIYNQEAFTQTVFDTLPIMIFVKDAERLSFSHVNNVCEQLLNRPREKIIGLNDFDIFPAQQAKCFIKADRTVLNSGKAMTINEEAITVGGVTRYLRTRKVTIKDNKGKIKYLLGVSEDITELRAAKIELDHLHQRMALAADAASIGIWEWNFKSDVLIWDKWMHKLYELDENQFVAKYSTWEDAIHPDDRDSVAAKLAAAIAQKSNFHAEFKVVLPSGDIRFLNADGRVYGERIIGTNFDISKRVIAENKVLKLAQTDQLTGLANRTALIKFAEFEFDRVAQTSSKIACLYFDLDKFKPINDTHGHLVGDAVLVEVANRLKIITRKSDCIARIGGDEFVIIIAQIENIAQVESQIQRYSQAIEQPIILQHTQLNVAVSIGYAMYPDEASSLDELLNKADEKMYFAKRNKLTQNNSQRCHL